MLLLVHTLYCPRRLSSCPYHFLMLVRISFQSFGMIIMPCALSPYYPVSPLSFPSPTSSAATSTSLLPHTSIETPLQSLSDGTLANVALRNKCCIDESGTQHCLPPILSQIFPLLPRQSSLSPAQILHRFWSLGMLHSCRHSLGVYASAHISQSQPSCIIRVAGSRYNSAPFNYTFP